MIYDRIDKIDLSQENSDLDLRGGKIATLLLRLAHLESRNGTLDFCLRKS